jgi:D-amino peptidase
VKIYILTDLEGAAGVSRWDQTRLPDATVDSKAVAMTLLTHEVNAAADGILDASPKAEIVVWDGHGNGGIDVLAIHPRVQLIARGGPIGPPYFLDESFDALFFVGQHAMAGTENAPLAHTYSSLTIEHFKINGIRVGELGARAMMAGAMGVATCFVAGDDKAVAEARALIPNVHGAVVKWGLGIELARHLSPLAARELIRKEAAAAVRDIPHIRPLAMKPPYEQEIRVKTGVPIEDYLRRGAERRDERTVILRSSDMRNLVV